MKARPLTLGIHPTARGYGWVAFEGPSAPFDWGVVKARGDKNAVCLQRVEEMLTRLTPETVVLEAFDRGSSSRSDRIARLCRAIVALAGNRGVGVAVYARRDITASFAQVGARSRQEIAAAVAYHIEALRHRLPKTRQPWEGEPKRMALFSAAALVMTHYHAGTLDLFQSLTQDGPTASPAEEG